MSRTSRSFRIAATATVAALGLFATACGSGSGDSTDAASDGEPVTINYWTWTVPFDAAPQSYYSGLTAGAVK